jgi:hypothetical protein
MPFLNFSTNETQMIVAGHTYIIKEMLKLHGALWNHEMSAWTLSVALDTPGLRQDFEKAAAERWAANRAADALERKRLRDYEKSPEGIAEKKAHQLNYCRNMGWACCDNCYLMDIKRGHVGCHEHGFFVKGILYTGD